MGGDPLSRLPHGLSFRFIDRILEYVPGKKIVTLKNVTFGEPYMTGHLPGDPSMPGAYLLEAMTQTAGMLVSAGSPVFLAKVRNFVAEQEVMPGDQLTIEANLLQGFGSLQRCDVKASVAGKGTGQAEIVLSVGSEQ
jgi:3-hydroxyacyl-[acyl-carrier-protein] dehydratase